MMNESDSEREPLLKQQQQQQRRRKEHQTNHQTQRQIKDESEISPFLRALIALRSGHLPDNAQLYAILHSLAAFCETLSGSVIPNEGKENQTQNKAENEESAELSNETIITLAALLRECATLFRISAGWLYGNENDRDGKMRKSSEKEHSLIDSNDENDKIHQGVRGNENEQWQKMFWHLGQALSSSTDSPVEVGMESDLTTDANQAAEAIKDAANQVQTDAVQGFKSITKILSMILSSDEFSRIPSDIVGSFSETLAGIANDVGARAFEVEEAFETDKIDSEKVEKDFLYPKEAVQDATEKVADAVEAMVNEPQPGRKGKQRRSEEDENATATWEDEFSKRIARLLTEVREDDTFRNATEKVLRLIRKYMNIAKEVRDDVQINISKEGSVGEAAANGIDEVREGIATKIESVHLETEASTHLSYHATATLQAAKEVLEGLAGGTSLEAVLEKANTVKEQAQSDSELRQWFDHALNLVANTIRPTESSDEESIQSQIKGLFDELHILLNTRPAIVRSFEDLQIAWDEFRAAFRSDVMLRKFQARFQHIKSMAKMVFINGVKDAKDQARFAFSTLIKSLLPSFGQILGNFPLPRVEFTSENLDAVVDDVHISSLQLVPDTLRLTTKTDWVWQSNESHVDTDFRIFVGGIKFAISDVSFYVQERYTAPSDTTCFACCSFGRSQSNWCLCRGPSSWLAYTESALLDVGFQRKGVGVVLDLRDAGQDVRKSSTSWWPPWSSSSDDRRPDELDDIIKQYQSSEEQAEIEETSVRTSFFDINDCQVEIDDSFDLKLRNSRHWVINTLLRYTSRPIIKIVLRRIISAQIRNGFVLADQRAYDLHLRAKLVRHRKLCLDARRSGRQMLPSLSDAHATPSDYMAVMFDNDAGKSKSRLEREQQEERDRQKEQREKEEEEIRKQREATEEEGQISKQPKAEKQMEVRPTGIVYHDEDGDYSIALGVKPSGMLLNERQHGPRTQRMRVREAIANPKRTAEEVGQRGRFIHEEAKKALQGERETSKPMKAEDRDLLDVPRALTQNAKEGIQTAQDALAAMNGEIIVKEDLQTPNRDDGWKSSAFDI